MVASSGSGTGERTQQAILESAARAFRDHGYDVATLDDIAGELGITRAAVLHHFGNKEEILRQVVTPFLAGFDAILDDFEAAGGDLTPERQRPLLVDVVELCAAHRPAAALLARDVTAHAHLGPELQIADRAARFAALVSRSQPGPGALPRALGAVGAILRPLIAPETLVDFDDPFTRRLLVDMATAVLATPDPAD
jgi:AcrR family transcriptional regulator